MGLDVVLQNTGNNIWDPVLGADGDWETADFFDSSLIVSFFTDARANASEVAVPERRRGWAGNESQDVPYGSKIWLYEQERRTQSTLDGLETAANNSLQWLLDKKYARSVISKTENLNTTGIRLTTTIQRPNSPIDERFFDLWDETGQRDYGV